MGEPRVVFDTNAYDRAITHLDENGFNTSKVARSEEADIEGNPDELPYGIRVAVGIERPDFGTDSSLLGNCEADMSKYDNYCLEATGKEKLWCAEYVDHCLLQHRYKGGSKKQYKLVSEGGHVQELPNYDICKMFAPLMAGKYGEPADPGSYTRMPQSEDLMYISLRQFYVCESRDEGNAVCIERVESDIKKKRSQIAKVERDECRKIRMKNIEANDRRKIADIMRYRDALSGLLTDILVVVREEDEYPGGINFDKVKKTADIHPEWRTATANSIEAAEAIANRGKKIVEAVLRMGSTIDAIKGSKRDIGCKIEVRDTSAPSCDSNENPVEGNVTLLICDNPHFQVEIERRNGHCNARYQDNRMRGGLDIPINRDDMKGNSDKGGSSPPDVDLPFNRNF